MKKIPIKNYYILAVLLAVTILLTLLLSNIYLNKEQLVSEFYNYSNKITVDEFDECMMENPDLIIYISDKYDLTYETFEKKLQSKINNLNLKDKLIYIDKSEMNDKFLNKINKTYGISVDLKKVPVIVTIVDNKMIKSVNVKQDSDAETIIEYEAFE